MEEAYFNDIRQQILEELNQSKKSIHVAVAWFTNQNLFDKLCEKIRQGLNVEVIIIDDFINNGDYGLDFQHFIKIGGKLRYGNLNNPMHHKFAIVDHSILINGSYNWTYYAESRNVENITITKSNQDFVSKFANEFKRMSSEFPLAKAAVKRSFEELSRKDYFSIKEYLGYDLLYKGRQSSTVKIVEAAARFLPEDKFIQREYKKITSIPIVKKTTTSLGISTRLNGIDNRFSILIAKGLTVPCKKSGKYSTALDNQTTINIKTYKGDDPSTDHNFLIGSFLINDLPKKPVGQAKLTVTFSLSEQGILSVSANNDESGSIMEMTYDVDKLVF
jgi:hypothetical protein